MKAFIKKYIHIIIIVILIATIVAIILQVYSNRPIKIGYSSGTTGILSEVGVDGRNSFLLKIKEVNEAGGINGRRVEAVVMDDQNDPEMVSKVHESFDAQGVDFIVGHIISALDEVVLKEAKADKLILSASMSSPNMDGIDDNFIRLTASYTEQVVHLSESLVEEGVESLTVVYDLRNKAYAEGFYKKMLEVYPGEIEMAYSIGSEESLSEDEITNLIAEKPTEGILLITPAVETARFAQLLQTKDVDIAKYSVSWSMTNDLFVEGGKAVEGMRFIYIVYSDAYSQAYDSFRNNYIDTYGTEPSTICFNTYEMISVLVEVLETEGSTDVGKIKAGIVGHEFDGLTGNLIIDPYGDRKQIFTMYEAKDEAFIQIEE